MVCQIIVKMAKAKCHKCAEKCGKGKVPHDVLLKLDRAFKDFQKTDSKSLLKKYLTQEIFDKIKTKKTSFGSTLLDCVQSGFENPDSGIGIYAADPETYTIFEDIFNPIIEDYHVGFKKFSKHPTTDWGSIKDVGNVDPKGEFVVSTRVRCCRSLEGFPFNPCLTQNQYTEIESKMTNALSSLKGNLKGNYYPLTGMTKDIQQKLIDDHFLFKEGDRFLQSANACRFWPTGRGIFHNEDKTFLVWINEEDHVRIISLQKGGDLGQVYQRFVSAVTEIENKVTFMKNDRLGYLTFCPTNLGTTIRASVHIKVPKLAKDMAKLNELAEKYHLQVRGTRGEHSEAEDGIYDISNKRRLGLTEYEVIKEMYDGIVEIIKLEKGKT
ncbi:arginine kinase-like [Leptinotarsa decemlineata]|uniref:arginine kinase-like n=1 Tax=Leptinotarsa decemlineata TaxID=7539 RepID=UPI003D30D248